MTIQPSARFREAVEALVSKLAKFGHAEFEAQLAVYNAHTAELASRDARIKELETALKSREGNPTPEILEWADASFDEPAALEPKTE